MATAPDSENSIVTLIEDNWNSSNTDSVTPTVSIMSEAGKRIDFAGNQDFIGVYTISCNTTPFSVGATHEKLVERVSIDIRTVYRASNVTARAHLLKMYNEVRRIFSSKINAPDSSYDILVPTSYVPLNNRNIEMKRCVYDVILTRWGLAR